MSMPASAKAEPPDAPVDVAYLPDVSMDVSMFSTDCAVSELQPSHAKLKTPLLMLDGFQLANTSAEKSVSDEQERHADATVVAEGSSVLKLVRDEQNLHVSGALVTKGSSVSKLVSEEH